LFGITSSDQYLCFMFDTEVKLNARLVYEEYLPKIPTKQNRRQRFVDVNSFMRNFVTAKEMYDAQFARPSLFSEVEFYSMVRDEMGVFPLEDDDLRKRNARMENDISNLGQGFSDIKEMLYRFLGDANNKIDFNNLNHRIYKILNFEFIEGTTSKTIKNMIYKRTMDSNGNKIDPLKAWLIEVRQMLIDYIPSHDGIIDQLIINLDLDNRPAFSNHPTHFNSNDIKLGQLLIDLMEYIFGSYTIKKMLTGTLFMDKKGIQFTVPPWRSLHSIITELGISLPHNDFRGIIGERLDRGEGSKLKIQSFIMDSIIAPWNIRAFRISSTSASQFFSELTTDFDKNLEEAYYTYVSEKGITQFLEWSSQQEFLGRDKALGSLTSILEEMLVTQIDRHIESLKKKYYYTPRELNEFNRWKRLAIECLYDTLFATDSLDTGIEERMKLYTFLASEGRQDVELDFSSGRQGYPFGSRGGLHDKTTFYKLKLDWGDWNFLFYQKHRSSVYEMANALSFSISAKTYNTYLNDQTSPRFLPHKMLDTRSEYVIRIADFLKEIAEFYGGNEPIRIYGFNFDKEGYGTRKDSKMAYFPTYTIPLIDPKMPARNVFYYEIDPNNFDSFSLEHFRVFLGALFADHQGFFVRTKFNGKFRNAGEYLFAFDLFGNLDLAEISIRDERYMRPTTPSNPLVFIDSEAYSYLSNEWNSIISDMRNNNLLVTIHHYANIDDWHNFLGLLPMLNELTSSFNSIGNSYNE
jgi:hypothetical protein